MSHEDVTFKVFTKFMKQQRELYGVGSQPSFEGLPDVDQVGPIWFPSDGIEEEKMATNLKNLPKSDPAYYTLLKAQYMMEKRRSAVQPL
jgi:hypothetical protein